MGRVTGITLSYQDPLNYLSRKPVQEFAKRRVIYSPEQPSASMYLVVLGRVVVSHTADDGGQTIGRIVCPEGLFGEGALIGAAGGSETAVALDDVTLMSWTRDEIEQSIEREPHLGVALAQYLVRQCLELQDRIESMAVYKTPERVMLSLVQLADTLGTPMADGSTRVASLTHHTIAEYVGTSREIVTAQMNRLRKMGLIRYSRKYIDVYGQAMLEALRQHGVALPHVSGGIARRSAGGAVQS